MKYDRDKHHRRSTRLKQYDYSQAGAYFITICTRDRELYFEKYPCLKRIVECEWHNISKRFSNIELDEFVIMPNHLHGIIIVWATLAVAHNEPINNGNTVDDHNEMVGFYDKNADIINENSDDRNKTGIDNNENIVGATLAVAHNEKGIGTDNKAIHRNKRAGASPAPTVGDIIGSFKSLCANKWLQYIYDNNLNALGKFWQSNYYDHIIRNEKELERIRKLHY